MHALPNFFRVRQKFSRTVLAAEDFLDEVRRQVAPFFTQAKGKRVAITVGSRGIANIPEIIAALVAVAKEVGVRPFIVPAMGSHGGGTPEGQLKILANLGITEARVGCEIRSNTEVVELAKTPEGVSVLVDKMACEEADAIFVCNRVKLHTMFDGDLQSGLHKMLMVGLGNPEGATNYHRAAREIPFPQLIRSVTQEIFKKVNILGGMAILENAYDETAELVGVATDELTAREPELLAKATELLPRLPFPKADLLLIDRIGKEISGTGLDSCLVGRKFNDKKATPNDLADMLRIAVRHLTPSSAGNAIGMGVADFCLSSLLEGVDYEATRLNALAAGHIGAAQPPLDYATDEAMLAAALWGRSERDIPSTKILRIRDTLSLGEVECSEAYYAEAQQRDDLEIVSEPQPWQFQKGMLEDFAFLT